MQTKAEFDVHMTLHVDFRDWCPDCVAGRGIRHQHRSSRNERKGREFSLDYAFMTAEDVGEDMCPVLVGYDNDSHGIWALAVRNAVVDYHMSGPFIFPTPHVRCTYAVRTLSVRCAHAMS